MAESTHLEALEALEEALRMADTSLDCADHAWRKAHAEWTKAYKALKQFKELMSNEQ